MGLSVADNGRISAASCAGVDLLAADAVAASGFAVRDHAMGEDFAPLRGTVTPDGDGLRLNVSSDAVHARVEATLRPWRDCIEVAGLLRSETPPPRCLTVRFGLPLALEGWVWHRDLNRVMTVNAQTAFTNAQVTTWGSGRMDLWPLAAVSDDTATVCVATRMDEPRLSATSYLGTEGLLAVSFDFGLSEHSPRFATEVPFRFFIYGLGAPTGMRGALVRYWELFPELFVERTDKLGGWFAWGDIARKPGPLCDFGLMFHEQPESDDGLKHDVQLGLMPMPYIEPSMYQLHFGDFDHRPSREEILERVTTYAKPDFTGRIWSSTPAGTPEREEHKRRMCASVLASGLRDREGELVINRVGQYHWVGGTKWAAQFGTILSPTIPDGRGEYLLEHARKNVLEREGMVGAYLDSYQAHMGGVSYAPAHLAAAVIPPIFAGDPPAPCVTVAYAAMEYVDALRDLIGEERIILPNIYSFRYPMPLHQFDVLGKEHWVAPSGWLMESLRALGRHKVVTQLPAYEDRSREFLRQMLLYDVFPGGYSRRETDPPNTMRDSYREVIPWLRILARLRWQPLTHAVADEADLRIERYGGKPGPIALVLYSPYVGRKAHLTVDAKALDLDDVWPSDPLDDEPLWWKREGDTLRIEAAVRAGDVRLIVIGDRGGQRRLQRMMLDDRVDDVELCMREFEMRRGRPHVAANIIGMRPEHIESPWLLGAREAMIGDEPTSVRARELLADAAARLHAIEDMACPEPQPVPEPPPGGVVLTLPFEEDFDGPLDPKLWKFDPDDPGVRLADGRLELEIKRGRSADIQLIPLIDFSAKPVQLDWDFQYNHAGHQWYLMLTFNLDPAAEGSGDVLRIRLDPRIRMRVENGETAPSNFKVSLTPYTNYPTNVPHHMTLQIGPTDYALWIDGQLHGRGPHRLGFTHGHFRAGVYSGHGGHGDVCWMDNLRVRSIEAFTDKPLP
ncbi:MAG: hypothetical protein J7M38_15920 [Armatimonadetes bacterium]|nr:hypothetical protein [Armatimonadota bacterium]